MTKARKMAALPGQEHSVPWFYPFAAAIEFADEGLELFADNLKFAVEASNPSKRDVVTTTDQLAKAAGNSGIPAIVVRGRLADAPSCRWATVMSMVVTERLLRTFSKPPGGATPLERLTAWPSGGSIVIVSLVPDRN